MLKFAATKKMNDIDTKAAFRPTNVWLLFDEGHDETRHVNFISN